MTGFVAKFSKLNDILAQLRGKYPGLSKRWVEAEALSRWDQAVGPQIAKHSRAIRVQDQVLWVEVDHPVWRSELHYRKRQILDLLNAANAAESANAANPAAKKPETLTDILFLEPRKEPRRQ